MRRNSAFGLMLSLHSAFAFQLLTRHFIDCSRYALSGAGYTGSLSGLQHKRMFESTCDRCAFEWDVIIEVVPLSFFVSVYLTDGDMFVLPRTKGVCNAAGLWRSSCITQTIIQHAFASTRDTCRCGSLMHSCLAFMSCAFKRYRDNCIELQEP